MAVVALEEMKGYLRVDSGDEDALIAGLIETGERMCADIARMEAGELEGYLSIARPAILYAAAYLYEHREEADHEELVQTLRSLLFGIRKEAFLWLLWDGTGMMEGRRAGSGNGRNGSLSREAGRGRTKPGIMCCLGRIFMSAGLM